MNHNHGSVTTRELKRDKSHEMIHKFQKMQLPFDYNSYGGIPSLKLKDPNQQVQMQIQPFKETPAGSQSNNTN